MIMAERENSGKDAAAELSADAVRMKEGETCISAAENCRRGRYIFLKALREGDRDTARRTFRDEMEMFRALMAGYMKVTQDASLAGGCISAAELEEFRKAADRLIAEAELRSRSFEDFLRAGRYDAAREDFMWLNAMTSALSGRDGGRKDGRFIP